MKTGKKNSFNVASTFMPNDAKISPRRYLFGRGTF